MLCQTSLFNNFLSYNQYKAALNKQYSILLAGNINWTTENLLQALYRFIDELYAPKNFVLALEEYATRLITNDSDHEEKSEEESSSENEDYFEFQYPRP